MLFANGRRKNEEEEEEKKRKKKKHAHYGLTCYIANSYRHTMAGRYLAK